MYYNLGKLSHWLAVLPLLHTAIAQPTSVDDVDISNGTVHSEENGPSLRSIDARAGSFYLRILPLGGSITAGWGSSTGNGLVGPPPVHGNIVSMLISA